MGTTLGWLNESGHTCARSVCCPGVLVCWCAGVLIILTAFVFLEESVFVLISDQ